MSHSIQDYRRGRLWIQRRRPTNPPETDTNSICRSLMNTPFTDVLVTLHHPTSCRLSMRYLILYPATLYSSLQRNIERQ